MRRLILIILTALSAIFPPSLLLSLVSPSSPLGCATALPHPSITRSTTAGLTIAAFSLANPEHHVSSVQIGGGLSALANSREFLTPSSGDAINVNSLPEGHKNLDTFKLAVLGAKKGMGSDCVYSMVEFQNNHPTEDIIIYSAHIEPSVVFPLEVADSIAPNPLESAPPPLFPQDYHQIEYDVIPNQKQRDRELHVHPGTTVTVPVSILPHYKRYDGPRITKLANHPHFPIDSSESVMKAIMARGTSSTKSPSTPESAQEHLWNDLSFTSSLNYINEQSLIRLDLYQMGQSIQDTLKHPPSSSFHYILSQGEVHETLLANTSWGFLRMKVPYTCSVDSKEYKYGLPNNLVFMDGGGGWYARTNNTRPSANEQENIFLYDLYMDNPSPDALKVLDIFATRPELIVVQDANSETRNLLYNPLVAVTIPPGKSNEYVATVRLLPDQLTFSDISSVTDLGYLELRTTAGDFSIGLDFIPNRNRWGVIHGIGQNHSTVGNLELTKSFKLSKLSAFLTVSEDHPYHNNSASTVNLYRKSDSYQADRTRQFLDQMTQQNRYTSLNDGSFTENDAFLLAQPSSINFGVITSGSRAIRIPINLANTSPFVLTVMRISVSMRMITDEGFVPLESDHHDLKVGIEFEGCHMIPLHQNGSLYEFPHTMMLLPTTAYHYPISVWCRFIVSPDHALTPRKYVGSIVIRSKADNLSPFMSYDDWTQESLLDNPISHRSVTAVPFQVSVIPGNFRISTDSLLFPSHYTMLPPEELSESKRRNKKKVPDYVDRLLEVTNNFMVPITITSMEISNSLEYSLCNSIFSIIPPTDSLDDPWQTAQTNQTWRIPIRFTFSSYLKYIKVSRKCILSLETDLVGKQSLPLIIHSGELLAEVQNGDGGMQGNECVITTNGTLSRDKGLACLSNWIETKKDGQFFSTVMKELKKQSKVGSCRESTNTKSPAEDYFESLLSKRNPHRMEPILLKLGAVSSGSIVKRSILLTNLNPSAVEVTASSSVFDDMNVTIGHKATSIPYALDRMPRRDGHIKWFLSHSTTARSFLSKFNYKVDISLSPRATAGELQSLYGAQAVEFAFQDSSDYKANEIHKTANETMTCTAGFIVSTDGNYRKSFTSRGVGSKKWKIPPGGVARFEVTLRTPDRTELKSDMSSFIATGLALETNFGQAFPIILSYSVLLGHLQLVPSRSVHITNETGQQASDSQPSMQIPMTIRDALTHSNSGGLPVSIQSTFSKKVFLGEIKSCNRWFDFSRKSKDSAPSDSEGTFLSNYLPVKAMNNSLADSPTVISVGEVYSTVSCLDEAGTSSFFSCALLWLNYRASIKPDGCGLADQDLFLSKSETSMNQLKSDATEALVHAVGYFTRPNAGGYVLPRDLMIFKKAREAWNAISLHGLNVVTGHLYAFSAYHDRELNTVNKESNDTGANNTGSSRFTEIVNNRSNLISVPVSTILLKTRLDPPQLFDGKSAILEFDPVHVAQTTECYIPVSNPSGVSVRVQLSAAAASTSDLEGDLFVGMKAFMQTSVTARHPWWTGEHYWMSGKDGQIIGAPHNVTFTSGSGSSVNLVQPSLQSISLFLYGCGTRCGKRSDAENTGDDVLYTTIGAGSGSGSTLLGHPWHVNTKLPQPPAKFNTIDHQPFAVGHSALQEVVLPPYGKAKLGPVLFRPTKRGEFNTSIFISNNLTGFEEVKLQARGMWEKLAFLDNDDGTNGGDIEFRNGRSALIFSGSTTAIDQPVVKSFVLANIGDVPVNISGVNMKSSEIKHFSHRSAHPTSTHHSVGFWSLFQQPKSLNPVDECSNAGFKLVGCKEANSSTSWIQLLFTWLPALSPLRLQSAPDPGNVTTNFTSFQNSFTLQPNENRTFFIEHRPDCVLRASYVSVVFDISGRDVITSSDQWHKTFRSDKLELLVGYSMNPYAYCLPYTPPASTAMEKLISFAVSSRICQNLFPGLVRRKEDHHYVRYELQINYVAVLFFALIMVLLFDLYTSFDLTYGNDEQGPSWKQTRRCLARADPVSADLVALGKEQTKHVLLSRFRKEKVMPTNCVLSDGSFCRDKPGGDVASSSAPYRRISSSSQQAKTFSDSVFHRQTLLANESKYDDFNGTESNSGLLPCGMSWRTAARRGISVSRSGSTSSLAEPQHLARTRSVLLKKKPLQPKDSSIADEPRYSAPLQSGQVSATDNTEHYAPTNIGIDKPPQDQTVLSTNPRNTVPVSIRKEPDSKPSTGPNELHQTKHAISPKATTNKAIPVNAPHGIKDSTSLIIKPTLQADEKLTRSDSFKDTQKEKSTSSQKQAMNERQSRIEKINSTEKPSKKSSKKVIGEVPAKSPTNGKDQISIPRPSSGKSQLSSPAVVKQPLKSQKAKNVSNGKDPAKEKDPHKNRHDAPQAKDTPTSKSNSKAVLPKRSTSAESVPNSTPVSSAQPSPRSESSLTTPKLMAAGELRPPPGLLPPPGFADPPPPGFTDPPFSSERTSPAQQTGEDTPTLLSPQPSFSDLSPSKTLNIPSELQPSTSPPFSLHYDSIPSPSLTGLLSPRFEDGDPRYSPNKEFVNSSMLITDLLPPPPRLTPPLLEPNQSDLADSVDEAGVHDLLGSSNNSFNVMNFLDGIMNDAAKPSQLEESVQNVAAAANPVPLDPWNSLSDRSQRSNPLAAIIGRISDVEATTLRGQDDQHEIAGIPLTSNAPSLLTPAALHSNISSMEPIYASLATEVEDEDDFLEPDSFYSQLLGGD